jgi:hypothetical protein
VTERKANAVDSLYGKKAQLATNVGKKVQDRPQEVYTPDWVLDAVRATFGAIELDPCAASVPEHQFAGVSLCLELDPACDGLALEWLDRSYVNPPFADLGMWLEKAAIEGSRGHRVIVLCPFRPHRRWFLDSCAGAQIVCLHYAVKFKGHKSAFPAPLCLISWNCVLPDLGSRETGRIQR